LSDNNPILISYYTGDQYYERCSNNLKKWCEDLGIPIIIENIPSLGSYWKNTLQKPSFILKKMEEFKKDVIWIDVDTKINQYPECFRKWDSDIILATHTGNLHGIKASPIGIKYNEASISFLKEWEKICLDRINNSDVDLDHDILKYNLLGNLIGKITINIMEDSLNHVDFTNGKIIDNGISRVPNKSEYMMKVLEKNKKRESGFYQLSLNDFKRGK
jgi:hypothetical protein